MLQPRRQRDLALEPFGREPRHQLGRQHLYDDGAAQRLLLRREHAGHAAPREFPLDEEAITRFRQNYRLRFEGNPQNSPLYRDVSDGLAPPGIEYYLPLFFDETASLLDYLAAETLIIATAGVVAAAEHFWQEINERYESLRYNPERPLPVPAATTVVQFTPSALVCTV